MTPAGERLPSTARLLRPADFARVYARRASAAAGPLVLYAWPNGRADGDVRLGISVSRRIGSAVIRNAWKRRLREAYRRIRAALPAGNDFVAVVRHGAAPMGATGATEIERTLAGLAARVVGRAGYGRESPRDGGPPPRRRGR